MNYSVYSTVIIFSPTLSTVINFRFWLKKGGDFSDAHAPHPPRVCVCAHVKIFSKYKTFTYFKGPSTVWHPNQDGPHPHPHRRVSSLVNPTWNFRLDPTHSYFLPPCLPLHSFVPSLRRYLYFVKPLSFWVPLPRTHLPSVPPSPLSRFFSFTPVPT